MIFYETFKIKNKNVKDVCGLDAAPHCTTLYLNFDIFGDYEGAEVGWDHVNNKSVRCYKLFTAFELKSNYPICFKIAPGNTSDSNMLIEICDGAKKVVGKKNIEILN